MCGRCYFGSLGKGGEEQMSVIDYGQTDILSCGTARYHPVSDIDFAGRILRVFIVELATAREARSLFQLLMKD